MPDFTNKFGSFFKADDVKDTSIALTIKAVAEEDVGPEDRSERKIVARFSEDERGLVLNKTRYEDAAGLFGSKNTDIWIGKKVSLAYDPNVKFGGKRVGGIVLRPVP